MYESQYNFSNATDLRAAADRVCNALVEKGYKMGERMPVSDTSPNWEQLIYSEDTRTGLLRGHENGEHSQLSIKGTLGLQQLFNKEAKPLKEANGHAAAVNGHSNGVTHKSLIGK